MIFAAPVLALIRVGPALRFGVLGLVMAAGIALAVHVGRTGTTNWRA